MLEDVCTEIGRALVEEPPFSIREGGMIADGYDDEVDRLRTVMNDGQGWVDRVAAEEKARTGIKTLKVGYNKVFGYYIEVSKSFADQVPANYIRKQTLVGAERYITQELKDMEATILGAKDKLCALEYELFCKRVRAMEERGTVSYWSVLFQSSSFEELLGAMDFISEVMEADQRVIDDLRVLQAQIAEKQQTLETSLAEQQSAKEALAVKNNELRDQRTEATGLIKEMEENEADYKDVLAEIEAEEEKTQKEIVRLSKELAAQQGNTTVTYGGYIWPVTTSKRVTSPFGKRNTGIKGASTNHRGIDIGGVYYSSTVYAAKAGTVIISSSNSVRGQYIVISHGSGNTTTYQHLSKRSVSVGAVVKQGQAIGVTGSSGVGSGPHLHFEITENGQLVNPLKYLTDYVKAWN